MEKQRALAALRRVAEENGVSLETVLAEIEALIHSGVHSDDGEIRRRWGEIPCAGDMPTPVELMVYLLHQLQERQN